MTINDISICILRYLYIIFHSKNCNQTQIRIKKLVNSVSNIKISDAEAEPSFTKTAIGYSLFSLVLSFFAT